MMKRDWYSILGWGAMIAVPIAPAFYFGFEFASDVYGRVLAWPAPWPVALAVGVLIGGVSAVGLELVGILSGHNAIRFLARRESERAAVCAIILVAYVGLGIAGLESLLAKGVVMFLVAPLVYLLVGMQKTLESVEVQEQATAADDRQWQRRRETTQAQRQHETHLKQMELDAQLAAEKQRYEADRIVAKAQAKAISLEPARSQHGAKEPAQSELAQQIECEDCNRSFGSVQALNAHGRFCPARQPANGRAKETT